MVNVALLARLEAKPGKEGEVAALLKSALPLANAESATTVWFALFGPANMAPELVARIHADVSKALDLPQTREFFEKNSFERLTDSPAEFAKLVEHDIQKWDALIKQVGAKLD